MMGHGLGPGFTMVATRMSVIFSFEGREFVFTFRGYASSESSANSAPPMAAAELFSISRRASTCRPFLLISSSSRCDILLNLVHSCDGTLAAVSSNFERPELLKITGARQDSRLTNRRSFENFGPMRLAASTCSQSRSVIAYDFLHGR